MNLGFFTMPIHPLDKDWRTSCARTARPSSSPTNSATPKATSASITPTGREHHLLRDLHRLAHRRTKRIKLGTGTDQHAEQSSGAVAANIAMLDHMLDGRFIFGISPGGLMSDAEVFGNLDADRNAMFLECINQVLEIWASEPPYNINAANTGTSSSSASSCRSRAGLPAEAAAEARIRRSS